MNRQSPVINMHHMTFCPKYRRNIFLARPELAGSCRRHIEHICKLKHIKIHAIAIETDHVHVMISIPAWMSVSHAAQLIKWYSSRWLRIENPSLRTIHKQAFWQRRYFSKSVSGSARTIKKYIENQGIREIR